MIKARMTRNGQTNGHGNFDWVDALIDSGLVGIYTGVASMIATQNLVASVEAGLLACVGWLMTKRGLKKNV